uniref:Uncharacterized protein n=1 Tax=Physcomitrium patens TaxID=3218 RepID=A0A2K1KL17_PHYPA|nr:hypothetical protein PHYPA_008147 [Physcomitrium patens]
MRQPTTEPYSQRGGGSACTCAMLLLAKRR